MLVTEQTKLTEKIDQLVEKFGKERSSLLPILQEVQKQYHYISEFAMQRIADLLEIHPVEVYSVVTFYSFLNKKYRGRFVIRLCQTISCDMLGKDRVARQLENELGISFGETTADTRFTLEWANCLGMCEQGPALLVNDQIFTQVTLEKVHTIIEACKKSFSPHAFHKKEVEL